MEMPNIGLGTFRLKDDVVVDAVLAGLELGYRHIDTAQIYDNEAEVGRALQESGVPRDEVFVTTKVWTANLARDALIASLRESRDKLRVDAVDLALIHWPSPGDALPVAHYMEALAEARELGLARRIGVSNFTVAHLEAAIAAVGADAIATQQIEVHPLLQNRRVVEFCREKGIALTAYMPLAYGKALAEPAVRDIAARRGVSPAQVALAWSLGEGFAVIPSSTRREHLSANLAAASLRLDEAERAAIAALERGERVADPDFAPRWD